MSNKITVIGSANIDLIMKMERLPEKGETVTGAEFMQAFGGKGANQAVGAARAGGNVEFIASVGAASDPDTGRMLQNYTSDGIDIQHIHRQRNAPTGRALIMIGEEGTNYISVAPGANHLLSPALVDQTSSSLQQASMIVLQNEIPMATIEHIFQNHARPNKIPVLWNFAPTKQVDPNILEAVDILVVNEVEAAYLAGCSVETDEDTTQAAARLHEMGAQTVIISLGKRGAYVCSGDLQGLIPGFKVEAVDTTAAGDVFCGSLAVALTEGKDWEEAVRFAHGASALSVQKMGAQPSAPHRNDIDTFLNNPK